MILFLIVRHHISESEKNVLSDAVFADNVTTSDEWRDVSNRLQDNGDGEAALHLLASVTTATATKGALETMKNIRDEEVAAEKRKQLEAFEAQEKLQLGGKKGKSKRSKNPVLADGTVSGETLQLRRKTKKVAISDQVEVQEGDGAMGVANVKTADQEHSQQDESKSEEPSSSEHISGLEGESSALDSSYLEDRSRSEGESDYPASSGETSESGVSARHARTKKRLLKTSGPAGVQETSEGYDADVE